MKPPMLGPVLVALSLTVSCANEVVIVDDGNAGATSGATSSGSGALTTHPVEIAIDLTGPLPGDEVLVLQSHADGSLVQSWRGSELPVNVIATDGDLVSYAYVASAFADSGPRVLSFRVSPQVSAVRHLVESKYTGPTPVCPDPKTMTAHVHVPGVPGATVVDIRAWPGSGHAFEYETPVDSNVEVTGCGDAFSLLTLVKSSQDAVVAFELFEDIALVDGGEVELVVAGKNEPRNPITVEVDDLAGAIKASAFARWDGMFHENFLFFSNEFAGDLYVDDPGPFVFSTNQIDLPVGEQLAFVGIADALSPEGCARSSTFRRTGRSDVPLPFHAHELAEPLSSGDTWSLGPGKIGDAIERSFDLGPSAGWRLHEDPAAPGFPAILPAFPADVPKSLEGVSSIAPTLTAVAHVDFDDADAFAGFATVGDLGHFAFPRTARSRVAFPCP